MALTQLHSNRPSRPSAKLDPTRIGAETGTIAINAALLLLLLAPAAPRLVEHATPRIPDVVILRPVPPRPITPPTPQSVDTRPPRPSSPAPQPHPVSPPRVEAPAVDLVAPSLGDATVDLANIAPIGGIGGGDAGVPATTDIGASLQTLAAPPPPYPRDALVARLEGTVVLDVHVDAAGRPVDVVVVTSSGHRALDRAAQRQVLQKWRFRPALQDGRAVPALGRVPVSFVLEH